jgi:hypothetical protein
MGWEHRGRSPLAQPDPGQNELAFWSSFNQPVATPNRPSEAFIRESLRAAKWGVDLTWAKGIDRLHLVEVGSGESYPRCRGKHDKAFQTELEG